MRPFLLFLIAYHNHHSRSYPDPNIHHIHHIPKPASSLYSTIAGMPERARNRVHG
jgi:hypothetical protein